MSTKLTLSVNATIACRSSTCGKSYSVRKILLLVTRNTRHYPKTDVAILSPADFLQLHGAALALMRGGEPGRPS